MTVGDPGSEDGSNPGLRYTCLQDVMTRFPETAEFPTGPCPAGIMAIHHFPACWDGKNLDSANHQDHMYNTVRGAFQPAGACPSSHPVRVPQVAYETMWDTTPFNDQSLWPEDGSQPFVWSYDDEIGHGTHGDYLFGWQGDALQRAMDDTALLSGQLLTQSVAEANACAVEASVDEEIDGCESTLSFSELAIFPLGVIIGVHVREPGLTVSLLTRALFSPWSIHGDVET